MTYQVGLLQYSYSRAGVFFAENMSFDKDHTILEKPSIYVANLLKIPTQIIRFDYPKLKVSRSGTSLYDPEGNLIFQGILPFLRDYTKENNFSIVDYKSKLQNDLERVLILTLKRDWTAQELQTFYQKFEVDIWSGKKTAEQVHFELIIQNIQLSRGTIPNRNVNPVYANQALFRA